MRVIEVQRNTAYKQNPYLKNNINFSAKSRYSPSTSRDLKIVKDKLGYLSRISLIDTQMGWQIYTTDGVRNPRNLKEMSDSAALLVGLEHDAVLDPAYIKAVENLSGNKRLSDFTKAGLEKLRRDIKVSTALTKEQEESYSKLRDESYTAWEKAKNASSYPIFRPFLEKVVKTEKEIHSIINGHPTTYNDLLNIYMPGWTTEDLDPLFGDLKKQLLPIIQRVNSKAGESSNTNNFPFLKRTVSSEKVETFVKRIAKDMGFDFKRGRISQSEHPFTESMNGRYDTRFTIDKLSENMTVEGFLNTIFSTLHEGGHSLVHQNIPPKFHGTPIDDLDMDLHESQSRFWENIIGKSREFWQHYLPELKKLDPDAFDGVSVDEIYKAANRTQKTSVRLESDEMSYNMHIILRYEVEKEMIENPNFDYSKLPELWNEKTQELIGIKPKNDKRGVLQDVHWSDGSIGYFPSYTIGNLIGPQIFNTMKKDIPDVQAKIAQGDFSPIKEWLTSHIYKYGNTYKTKDMVKRITGEELNPQYFLDYIKTKFSEIYGL